MIGLRIYALVIFIAVIKVRRFIWCDTDAMPVGGRKKKRPKKGWTEGKVNAALGGRYFAPFGLRSQTSRDSKQEPSILAIQEVFPGCCFLFFLALYLMCEVPSGDER